MIKESGPIVDTGSTERFSVPLVPIETDIMVGNVFSGINEPKDLCEFSITSKFPLDEFATPDDLRVFAESDEAVEELAEQMFSDVEHILYPIVTESRAQILTALAVGAATNLEIAADYAETRVVRPRALRTFFHGRRTSEMWRDSKAYHQDRATVVENGVDMITDCGQAIRIITAKTVGDGSRNDFSNGPMYIRGSYAIDESKVVRLEKYDSLIEQQEEGELPVLHLQGGRLLYLPRDAEGLLTGAEFQAEEGKPYELDMNFCLHKGVFQDVGGAVGRALWQVDFQPWE